MMPELRSYTITLLTLLMLTLAFVVVTNYSTLTADNNFVADNRTRIKGIVRSTFDNVEVDEQERTESFTDSASQGRETRPHVIFILADDLGYNDVGYHNSHIISPTIDKLATTGVRLENYYVANLCSPSRAQLMTGRYQMRNGISQILQPQYDECLPLSEVTIADVLRNAGYSTHLVGKWHLGYSRRECTPTHRGFDSFLGFLSGSETYYDHTIGWPQNGRHYSGYDFYVNERIAYEYKGQYSTHIFARRTMDIIEQHNATEPLFIFLSLQAVHSPFDVPKKYIHINKHFKDPTRRIYAGMVTCMDEAIGNITQALKNNNMWDNTVLIFSTDNGGPLKDYEDPEFLNPTRTPTVASNWPLRGGKGSDWEGGIRGAAFVHSPLLMPQVRGTENRELMGMVDWLPTVAGYLGKANIDNLTLDGYNIWSTLSQGDASPRQELLHNVVVSEHQSVYGAIRVGDWKLLQLGDIQGANVKFHVNRGLHIPPPEMNITIKSTKVEGSNPYTLLFNIKQDPRELHNLAAEHPQMTSLLRDKLTEYSKFIEHHGEKTLVDPEKCTRNKTIGPWL
ncbi:arylsulfatase B-like isoform X2 [Amphiura filiformis]|uniref:arylsulfatase B-like isoform X2 n=1 Tax=Amphiura filiformis TaxID=82378 RepID=UPI003B212E77